MRASDFANTISAQYGAISATKGRNYNIEHARTLQCIHTDKKKKTKRKEKKEEHVSKHFTNGQIFEKLSARVSRLRCALSMRRMISRIVNAW